MNPDPILECVQSVDVVLEPFRPGAILDALTMQVVKHSLSMAALTGCDATEVLDVVYREALGCIAHRQTGGMIS